MQCQLGHGVQALFQHVNVPPTKIMLLGGICSAATRPIAECSHLMNLIQVYACVGQKACSQSAVELKMCARGGRALGERAKLVPLKLESSLQ